MSSGYTVTPVEDAEGNIVDFNVHEGPNGYQSSSRDYVELDDGSTHHVFENVSIDEDYLEDYYTTLANSDERIPSALEWAADNMSPDFINTFNSAIDNDDVDTINEYLEYLLNQYPSDEYNNSDEEYVEDEELTDDDQAVIDYITEELAEQEALGDDVADEWDSISQQALANGDEVYAAVADVTSAFHQGRISAEDAINHVLSNYNIHDVARVYQHIIGQ
jgi:hypothetical protein